MKDKTNKLLKILIGFKASLLEQPLDIDKIQIKTKERLGSSLEELKNIAQNCQKCGLNQSKNLLAFGKGNRQAQLMLIGEAPELNNNNPDIFFTREAATLLEKMLLAIDIKQETVYITNAVKCSPQLNQKLQPEEIRQCSYLLQEQINLVNPLIICTLGKVATQSILQTDKPISQIRGQIFKIGSALLIPTFHPNYLLHSPQHKKDAWEDLKLIRRKLNELS